MSNIRVSKRKVPFAQISREPINDKRLSYKARGILTYLLDKPDNWKCSLRNLVKSSDRDGIDAVRSGLKELRDLGYAELVSDRSPEGHLMGSTYEIYELPVDRDGENPDVGKTPTPEKLRRRENPDAINDTDVLNNTDLLNNTESLFPEMKMPSGRHLFKNSPIVESGMFEKYFTEAKSLGIDIWHYFQRAKNRSAANHKMSYNWFATIEQDMLYDKKRNDLVMVKEPVDEQLQKDFISGN